MPLRGPVPVLHQTRENSEKVQVGPTTIYIFEDGTHTDNRVGCMLLELPAGASGPPSEFSRLVIFSRRRHFSVMGKSNGD